MAIAIIITDVTEMHGGNYCVAGWCAVLKRMIRPLPDGANWTKALLKQHCIVPGATVSFKVLGRAHAGVYPHSTEDTIVDSAKIRFLGPGSCHWFGANAPPVAANVSSGFGGRIQHNSVWNGVRRGVYVPVGAQASSLCALMLSRRDLEFIEDFDKLKVHLNDGTATYKLAVSSMRLKEAWRAGGLKAVQAALSTTPRFHVRLGLARGFGNPPDRCYIMLNGVHG